MEADKRITTFASRYGDYLVPLITLALVAGFLYVFNFTAFFGGGIR